MCIQVCDFAKNLLSCSTHFQFNFKFHLDYITVLNDIAASNCGNDLFGHSHESSIGEGCDSCENELDL